MQPISYFAVLFWYWNPHEDFPGLDAWQKVFGLMVAVREALYACSVVGVITRESTDDTGQLLHESRQIQCAVVLNEIEWGTHAPPRTSPTCSASEFLVDSRRHGLITRRVLEC